MGFIKKICVGAAAVVSSALVGYFIYKNYFQPEEKVDDEENVSSKTASNSAGINKIQNVSSAEDVNHVEHINSTKDVNKTGVSTSQCSSLYQSKTKGRKSSKKPKTGYMGLRKGFLL